MKKLTALLLVLALVLSMTACVREGTVETQPPLPEDTANANQTYTEPDSTDRTPSIKLLNPDPATDAVWRALAQEYSGATGIEVIAMTAAPGAYADLLTDQLGGMSPVTLYYSYNGADTAGADLSGSAAFAALADPRLAPTQDGKVTGLPFRTGSYGILANRELLEKAGLTQEELLTLEGFTQAVAAVTEQADALGFQAFAAPALETVSGGTAQLMAAAMEGLGSDAGRLRPVWDLATGNFGGDPAALIGSGNDAMFDAFLGGEALFCLATSADLPRLEAMADRLVLLPIPTAEGGLVGLGSEGCWCVNSTASPVDIEATVAFLDWVLTEKADAFQGFSLPYGEDRLDLLTRQALGLDAQWVPMRYDAVADAPWLNGLRDALAVYAADPVDGSWAKVLDVLPAA